MLQVIEHTTWSQSVEEIGLQGVRFQELCWKPGVPCQAEGKYLVNVLISVPWMADRV